jgi:L-lactate utilization protein LutC
MDKFNSENTVEMVSLTRWSVIGTTVAGLVISEEGKVIIDQSVEQVFSLNTLTETHCLFKFE